MKIICKILLFKVKETFAGAVIIYFQKTSHICASRFHGSVHFFPPSSLQVNSQLEIVVNLQHNSSRVLPSRSETTTLIRRKTQQFFLWCNIRTWWLVRMSWVLTHSYEKNMSTYELSWNAENRVWEYSQLTLRVIRLLTAGGTSLLAMHRYAPICFLSNFSSVKLSPLNVSTETRTFNVNDVIIVINIGWCAVYVCRVESCRRCASLMSLHNLKFIARHVYKQTFTSRALYCHINTFQCDLY